jgi:hypothetical protein
MALTEPKAIPLRSHRPADAKIQHCQYLADVEMLDDNSLYPAKPPSSAKRYQPIQHDESFQTTNDQQASHQRKTQEKKKSPRQQLPKKPQRSDWFYSRWIGTGMVCMLALWFLLAGVITWWDNFQQDLQYGKPRTFHIDVKVGHQDEKTPSHFIACNLHGQVQIIELPGGDGAKAQIYVGPTLGEGQDLVPVTLAFRDLTGDGKPDMIVIAGVMSTIFINDMTATPAHFRPLKPGEQYHLES